MYFLFPEHLGLYTFTLDALAIRSFCHTHHRRHHSLVCISCYQSRHLQSLVSIFPALHQRRTLPAKRDGH
jgi:hypothetical protein